MYNFRDVTETSEGVSLPSEALKINGEYIENLIEGYRTLTVEGREALSPEVATYETGIRDGSTMKGKRYPARVIRITYQLIAASNEAFREAYNKLAAVLDVEDAELIFDDEPDKFFKGTPCLIGEVAPGRNAVVGEFEILCLDPFKYSVMEYEARPVEGTSSILLDYNGTYKSFPTLRAEFFNEDEASEDGETVTELTGSGDCGYVAFFNEDEKIIQIGDPDEVDGDNSAYAKSQTLVNQKFNQSTSWGTAAKTNWKVNSGITSSSAVEQAGTIGMKVASYTTPAALDKGLKTLLKVSSTAGRPYVHYEVSAALLSRTETTAQVQVSVKTRLDNSQSYMGVGAAAIRGQIYFGGAWYSFTIRDSNFRWEGTAVHTSGIRINVTGLTQSAKTFSDIRFKATNRSGGTAGNLDETACSAFKIGEYPVSEPESYYLSPTNFGTGSNWHGPSITRTIPADASGVVGATNFTLSYDQKMSIGKESSATNQLGAFQVLLVSGSGTSRKVVAGVNVYKGASGKSAKLRLYLNNKVVKTINAALSYTNLFFSAHGTTVITKTGSTVTFTFGGHTNYTFRDADIAETAVTEVTFTMTQFGMKPALAYNGLNWVKFVKNNCTTWKDIPNKFSANDVVEADCKTGEILLNGNSTPALGALGNDWEEFYLTPGLNQIGFSYSEWVEEAYAPTFKVRYREVFL